MKYRVFKEIRFKNHPEQYKCYGLKIIKDGREVRRISDVSCSYWKIAKLCALCNKLKVSEYHIDDVVEDFIVSFSIS